MPAVQPSLHQPDSKGTNAITKDPDSQRVNEVDVSQRTGVAVSTAITEIPEVIEINSEMKEMEMKPIEWNEIIDGPTSAVTVLSASLVSGAIIWKETAKGDGQVRVEMGMGMGMGMGSTRGRRRLVLVMSYSIMISWACCMVLRLRNRVGRGMKRRYNRAEDGDGDGDGDGDDGSENSRSHDSLHKGKCPLHRD